MAKLSIAIMAHQVRADLVAETLAKLDQDPVVIWDTGGPPSADKQRRWHVGRRAWECYDCDADWHLVLQDDALVCADLWAGTEKALDHLPGEGALSLYLGTRRPAPGKILRMTRTAGEIGASWVRMGSLNWGVAIAYPVAWIDDMVEWCERQETWTYDTRVGQYLIRVLKMPTFYTWPSLVDHRDVPSLLNHGPGRVAHNHHTGSALELDWNDRVVSDNISMTRQRQHSSPRRSRITEGGTQREHR